MQQKEAVNKAIKGAGFNNLIPITSMIGIKLSDGKLRLLTTDMTNTLCIIKKDYQSCDLCWREAISYLQGQSIILDAKYNKGFVTLTYKYLPIGICKNLGNRANNLYPQSWRIRTTHVPQEETTIFKI